jgi:ferredoxin
VRRRWRGKFPLTAYLDERDYLISIPKFKTHELTILTAAIKNNFGLVSGTYKTELHRRNIYPESFSKAVVDVYQEARPTLSIVDGITAMEGDGPGTAGKLRQEGLIVTGADAVAVDSVLTLIMGLEPLDILTTRIAAERKLGVADINSIEIVGERLEDLVGEPFELPKTSLRRKIPIPLQRLAAKLVHFYPRIVQENCVRCGTCIAICPQKVIHRNNERITIHYAKCISCFCCQESCPASAIKIRRSLLAKLLGL